MGEGVRWCLGSQASVLAFPNRAYAPSHQPQIPEVADPGDRVVAPISYRVQRIAPIHTPNQGRQPVRLRVVPSSMLRVAPIRPVAGGAGPGSGLPRARSRTITGEQGTGPGPCQPHAEGPGFSD